MCGSRILEQRVYFPLLEIFSIAGNPLPGDWIEDLSTESFLYRNEHSVSPVISCQELLPTQQVIPDILQFVENIAGFVFDQNGSVWGLKHPHCQLLRKHVDNEGMQSIHTTDFVGDMNSPCLIPKLQEKDA